jgi:hypothetical protein
MDRKQHLVNDIKNGLRHCLSWYVSVPTISTTLGIDDISQLGPVSHKFASDHGWNCDIASYDQVRFTVKVEDPKLLEE